MRALTATEHMSEGIGQMDVTTLELKFLLKLLGLPGYRGPMNEKLSPGKSAAERDKACKELVNKGIVAYRTEIKGFAIASTGQNLLKLDTSNLPISSDELNVLEAAKGGKRVTPSTIKKVASDRRQALIRSLEERGFLTVSDRDIKIAEVWLTPQGEQFLRHEFKPSGGATVSLNLLASYINFLRQAADSDEVELENSEFKKIQVSNASEVLELIVKLDRQHNTDNYLPIFYLRNQVALGREELDCILYELQRDDKIELDTLQEAINYNEAQIAAGIPQSIGGPLFFISLSD